MDYGASFYVASGMRLFTTYKSKNFGVVKMVNVNQDRERSLLVTGTHGLVKLFNNGMTLKKEAKLVSWKRNSTHGVPSKRVGEVC